MKNKYIITQVQPKSKEAYLTAIFEVVRGGLELHYIVQNSKVSHEINPEHIKLFLATINKCDVAEIPDLTEFIKTNVIIKESKEIISSSNIIMELDL